MVPRQDPHYVPGASMSGRIADPFYRVGKAPVEAAGDACSRLIAGLPFWPFPWEDTVRVPRGRKPLRQFRPDRRRPNTPDATWVTINA